MMIHGFDRTLLHQDLLGIVRGAFEFTGKAAHASADPWEGVNALDAVIQTYNASACCASRCDPTAASTASSPTAGAAANIIPEYGLRDLLRAGAEHRRACGSCYKRVVACAEGAAKATGCTLKVHRSTTASTSR